jgi:hypothetical protein
LDANREPVLADVPLEVNSRRLLARPFALYAFPQA